MSKSKFNDNCLVDPEKSNVNVAFYLKNSDYEGRMQVLILLTQCLFSFTFGMILFSFPYIFYQPEFECKNESGDYENCSKTMACEPGRDYRFHSGNDINY